MSDVSLPDMWVNRTHITLNKMKMFNCKGKNINSIKYMLVDGAVYWVGSINLKRCLCLAIRNRVFGEYNSNPEGFCSSTSGTCATVSSKMTPFSPHKFSCFFRFLEKQPEKGVLDQLEIQIFDILEPTWPAWMGRVSFRVRPFLGPVPASRTTLNHPFLLTDRRKVDF